MREPRAITDQTITQAQTVREGAAMMRKRAIPWLVGAMLVTLAAPAFSEPSDLSIQPSEQLQSMANSASEIISWSWTFQQMWVTNNGKQALNVVLVASLICEEGRRVCAEGQGRPVSMRPGEKRSAASMFGSSKFFDEGTPAGMSCCEGQTSIGPEGISLKQAQAAFGESALRHPAVLVVAAVPAEGRPTITSPLAIYFVMVDPLGDN